MFRERLPRKPYYTDELTTGLSIADVSRALGARYIQPNGPTHRHWIVFDVDQPAATLSWDDVGAPAPNITVTNRANGHAHLIYGLDTPIRTLRMARWHHCGMPPPSRPPSGINWGLIWATPG